MPAEWTRPCSPTCGSTFPATSTGSPQDVARLRDGAVRSDAGRRHQDVEFVAEAISRGTAANGHGYGHGHGYGYGHGHG